VGACISTEEQYRPPQIKISSCVPRQTDNLTLDSTALATKKKWEMHSSNWEFINKLMDALEVCIGSCSNNILTLCCMQISRFYKP
jgi:hypothetical protein